MDLIKKLFGLVVLVALGVPASAAADGIAYRIVNSPLSASGTVRDAHIGINVLLQSDAHPGPALMDPRVIGYGIPAGGRLEIELLDGYERDPEVPLSQKALILISGAPHQPLRGKDVGYRVEEGKNPETFVIRPTKPEGLVAEMLMSPLPGAKADPIPQRGIKAIHIGFRQFPFVNRGAAGLIEVRILDASDRVVHSGRATVEFLDAPVPQVQPSNFPDKRRSHNWQTVGVGQTLGKAPGTLPIAYAVYDVPVGMPPRAMVTFRDGQTGIGVLSSRQLADMDYTPPEAIRRYSGGLVVEDSNGDGRLDPRVDRTIGGVTIDVPPGAIGQDVRSFDLHGASSLTRPLSAYSEKAGKLFGGAVGLLQFTAGNKPGRYEPTLALLRDPGDLTSGDGSAYTFTVLVE